MILKTELIDRVWKKVNIGKQGRKERLRRVDIEKIINTMLDEMAQCMIDGEDIRIDGFGKFLSRIRRGRVAFYSINKKKIQITNIRVINLKK